MTEMHLAVFKGMQIRRMLHNNEWWFSIVDIFEVLTGTERPRKYWSDLKKKLSEMGYDALSEKIGQLSFKSDRRRMIWMILKWNREGVYV
ncbi:MAG: hypothetical protein HZA12_01030 [Nitrospirae bacterium]|nr:hypothetical protein [Nitrospirota bacterium]